MTSCYTPVTVTGYNASPPPDDGSEVAGNVVTWAFHKDKLGDPLKTAIEAINTNLIAMDTCIQNTYATAAGQDLIIARARSDDGTVATGTTTIPNDNTKPQITEGDEYLTVSITPQTSTNKLYVRGLAYLSTSDSGGEVIVALFQDGSDDAIAVSENHMSGASNPATIAVETVMDAGGTDEITFSLRAGPDSSGTVTFNGVNGNQRYGGAATSFLEVLEVQE